MAGQHVHLRVFFGSQTFESHSFTIANAPSSISALGDIHPGGIMLAARAYGDWTQGLHSFARECERSDTVERVKVLLDGPYGDSTLDYGTYESVLLVAGGSGVTFTLGILDNLVGRVVRLGRPNGKCTQRISFAWYIRSFRDIAWSEPYLMTIARMAQGSSVEVIFHFFVTRLCDFELVTTISNSSVEVSKPSISELLAPLLDATRAGDGGGIGVGTSGPESLTRSAQNTVARIWSMVSASVGDVELHTERFAL